jgi:hypothetical protein
MLPVPSARRSWFLLALRLRIQARDLATFHLKRLRLQTQLIRGCFLLQAQRIRKLTPQEVEHWFNTPKPKA